MSRRPPRLEWISILYLALFVLAVLTPRMIRGDVLGLEEVQIEEILIFTFGITGLLVFSAYQRLMERREQEAKSAEQERDKAKQELVSSYEYIGTMNRQMDALKRVANDTAAGVLSEDHRKELFRSLAASAATSVGTLRASVRVVALRHLRTLHEYHADPVAPLGVPNKELRRLHEARQSHEILQGEGGDRVLVIPSDRRGSDHKVFLLLHVPSDRPGEPDHGILKVYANQAELLHHSMEGGGAAGDVLSLVRHAENQSVGDVS